MSRKQAPTKILAAIQYLRELHSQPASPALRRLLDLFNTTPQSHDAFSRGVQEFTRIANLNYQERIAFFGNSFCGVHYNNDLTAHWNALHPSEKICAYQLNLTAPHSWNYKCVGGKNILVYKGNDLAGALDRLLQGPTVIDCGMFCQLSIWFGIRSALGNEKFNQLFGFTPFYITQLFYNGIDDPLKPYSGNPLFDFFERTAATQSVSQSVSIAHIANHPDYQLKHPGGNYQGENCIEIDGKLTIFDPALSEKLLTKTQIAKLLCDTFNAPQNERDQDKIAAYQKLDQSETYSSLGFTYAELIHFATILANKTIDRSEFDFPVVHQLSFNFERFIAWTQQRLQRDFSHSASYQPLSDSEFSVSATLSAMIPFENRHDMSFSTYRQESILHQQLYQQSLHFCHSVMSRQSCMVVLTGRAGIGKTAAAVSCAKELASRGKNVVWITEVTVKGWMNQAKSIEELSQSQTEIRRLLATNPDAVFLDDDNIVGYAGQVLLEEIYTWYICNPGKGLFITSNETVSFEKCFGVKLDEQYYFVPFAGYLNPAMQGIVINANLNGQSQRPTLAVSVTDLDDHEKMIRLMRVPQGVRSVGVIITPEAYRAHERELSGVEFVPGFKSFSSITMHLYSTEGRELGPDYDALTDVQKRWTYRFPINKFEQTSSGMLRDTGIYRFHNIGIKRFEQSSCDVIAVELLRQPKDWKGREVNDNCVEQLLRVINYAFDRGGKKIIIVNATGFTQQELITQIKIHIDERDKERTIARLDQLFYSSELLVERTPVELPRSTSGALICRPSTGALAVLPRDTAYNVAAFFQLMARLQQTSQTANPDGAPQYSVQ